MNPRIAIVVIAAALAGVSGRTSAQGNAVTTFKDAQGAVVGTATLQASPGGGLQINLDIQKLPPGLHGIHVHDIGKCDGPDFASAGPHFNPTNKKHGQQNPEGMHAGDMMNLTVDPDGKAARVITDPRVTLGPATDPNSVYSGGGKALVIHAAADDMKTDPSGNSGARIACGVIVKEK